MLMVIDPHLVEELDVVTSRSEAGDVNIAHYHKKLQTTQNMKTKHFQYVEILMVADKKHTS